MSTVIGAEYVISLSLHSCGQVDLVILNPSSISGLPTVMLRYLKPVHTGISHMRKPLKKHVKRGSLTLRRITDPHRKLLDCSTELFS